MCSHFSLLFLVIVCNHLYLNFPQNKKIQKSADVESKEGRKGDSFATDSAGDPLQDAIATDTFIASL